MSTHTVGSAVWRVQQLMCVVEPFLSCLLPLIQSESLCKAFHMEISFILMYMNQTLLRNKTVFFLNIYERLGTRPHFETEAKGNSEIVYSVVNYIQL